MTMVAVGAYLQTYRDHRHFTQEHLTHHGGVASRSISQWETGRNPPGSDTMAARIDLLGASPDDIHILITDPTAGKDVGIQRAYARIAQMPFPPAIPAEAALTDYQRMILDALAPLDGDTLAMGKVLGFIAGLQTR